MLSYIIALFGGNILLTFLLIYFLLAFQFFDINIYVFGDLYQLGQGIKNANYILNSLFTFDLDEKMEILDGILLCYKSPYYKNYLKSSINLTLINLNKSYNILAGVILDKKVGNCYGRKIIYRGVISTSKGKKEIDFIVCSPIIR